MSDHWRGVDRHDLYLRGAPPLTKTAVLSFKQVEQGDTPGGKTSLLSVKTGRRQLEKRERARPRTLDGAGCSASARPYGK
jgi:hypothetical protein